MARHALLRSGVCAALLALLASPASAGGLYQMVDERGVIHFTDVPADRRYVAVERLRHRRPPAVRRYDPLIRQVASREGIPAALVKAVVATESRFDPRAVSPKGAMGLMQLMPQTARTLGVDDPFEPEENVRGGARYLRTMHERYRDWTRALAAYNAGPAAVDRYGGMPPYRETREYVNRVLTYYRRYHGDFR